MADNEVNRGRVSRYLGHRDAQRPQLFDEELQHVVLRRRVCSSFVRALGRRRRPPRSRAFRPVEKTARTSEFAYGRVVNLGVFALPKVLRERVLCHILKGHLGSIHLDAVWSVALDIVMRCKYKNQPLLLSRREEPGRWVHDEVPLGIRQFIGSNGNPKCEVFSANVFHLERVPLSLFSQRVAL